MATDGSSGMGKLIGFIFISVLVGVPITAYLWETLNRLMSGHVEPVRLAVSIPVLVLFAGLLAFLARSIRRLDEPPAA
jgi:hypothetical protein